MIITTLLNFWLAISAVVDPSFAFYTARPEISEGHRAVLKKYEPLQLPMIEFSQPDPTIVHKNALFRFGSLTVDMLKEIGFVQSSLCQNLAAHGNVFAKDTIDNINTTIMEIQAEIIIRQLNRLAESHGNPMASIDPYWAHYELLDSRQVVLVDAFACQPQSSRVIMPGIKLAYETARQRLQTIAVISQWLIEKIETYAYLLEHSWSAKNDLRFSFKPDFVSLQKSMSRTFLEGGKQDSSSAVHVANRRCNVVD